MKPLYIPPRHRDPLYAAAYASVEVGVERTERKKASKWRRDFAMSFMGASCVLAFIVLMAKG